MAKKEQSPIRERLVILEHDGMTCDILPVRDVGHDRILAGSGEVSVPMKDVKQFISPEGRVYVAHVPEWYINESKHLAEVEMATVINQAVNYQKPGTVTSRPSNFLLWFPWILAVFAIIFAILKR
ncbi:hypothetical protein SAMN04489725_11617 [Alicyclobacillus hesperidum]|uniref:Uncharacterized protein n=1 Tax=Alicyclobacillus hesperidum TaxID=89784 RepID=A0A1H2WP76_9BACL|nr:hypothetical protein [Alicyclobacillus hesperidum]SDW82266.1 hypothetical protein SAMN04489725_11617 [Alicyclobacillus hesperidum]